jgi:hypothetical protein
MHVRVCVIKFFLSICPTDGLRLRFRLCLCLCFPLCFRLFLCLRFPFRMFAFLSHSRLCYLLPILNINERVSAGIVTKFSPFCEWVYFPEN